jgi:hypothetical protein
VVEVEGFRFTFTVAGSRGDAVVEASDAEAEAAMEVDEAPIVAGGAQGARRQAEAEGLTFATSSKSNSGFKGVCRMLPNGTFKAHSRVQKLVHLGYFATAEEAALTCARADKKASGALTPAERSNDAASLLSLVRQGEEDVQLCRRVEYCVYDEWHRCVVGPAEDEQEVMRLYYLDTNLYQSIDDAGSLHGAWRDSNRSQRGERMCTV